MSVSRKARPDAHLRNPCYESPGIWIGGGLLVRPSRDVFRDKLDSLLSKSGKSGADLARYVGVDRSMITHWKNRRSPPNLDQLEKMAEFFGVSIADLVRDVTDDRDSAFDLERALEMVTEVVKDKLKPQKPQADSSD